MRRTWMAFVLGLVLGGIVMRAAAGAAALPPVKDLPKSAALPDALTMLDGTPVTSAEEWNMRRRPELVQLVQHYMYGFAPEAPPIEWRKEAEDTEVLGGTATLRQIEITLLGMPENAPKIHLAIFLPKTRAQAAPVFLAINKCGNFGVSQEPAVLYNPTAYVHKECPAGGAGCRGFETDGWSVDLFIQRGYAFATFHESDLDLDVPDSEVGVQAHYKDLPYPAEAQWATIRCWAWGFSRCIDYLVQDSDLDPARIAVTGHSRRGKTALLAAALDTRVALAAPHQSGTGGTALSRDNDQETVKRINTNFPHWFNGNFKAFSDNEAQLPFDQHLLVALVAPRALIDTQGTQDKWANGGAALRGLCAADAVWKLLGAPGLKDNGMLELGAPVTSANTGNLLQYRLDTKHELNRLYWEKVLDFADRVYAKK